MKRTASVARRVAVATGLSTGVVLTTGLANAWAQDAAPDPVAVLGQQINLLWIIIGAALVVFMQAGFALVETGFCQAKHAAHVVSTNFAIFGLGLHRLLRLRLRARVRRLLDVCGLRLRRRHRRHRRQRCSASGDWTSCSRAASPHDQRD